MLNRIIEFGDWINEALESPLSPFVIAFILGCFGIGAMSLNGGFFTLFFTLVGFALGWMAKGMCEIFKEQS